MAHGVLVVAALTSVACSGTVPGGDAAAAGGAVPLYSAPTPDEADLIVAEASDTGLDEDDAFVEAPGIEELNGFYLVLHHDRPYLLLHESITAPAGAPVPIPYNEGEYAVAAWAPYLGDTAALGERAAPGQEVVFYREDGVACFGTTGRPVVFYRGMPGWDVDMNTVSSRFVSTIAQGHARSVVLAAPVTVSGGDCEGALWARPALLPPPRLFVHDGEFDEEESQLRDPAGTKIPVDIDDDGVPEAVDEWSLDFQTERGWTTVSIPPAYTLCRLPRD